MMNKNCAESVFVKTAIFLCFFNKYFYGFLLTLIGASAILG